MALKIDLGLRTYEIVDPDDNYICTLRFNPSDIGFVGRWQAFQDRAKKLMDNPPKTPAAMDLADGELKKLLDKAFAAPCSDIFQGQSCFSMCTDGQFILVNVLEALVPVVTSAVIEAQKASEARMAKHTAAYEGSTAGLAPGQAAT